MVACQNEQLTLAQMKTGQNRIEQIEFRKEASHDSGIAQLRQLMGKTDKGGAQNVT
jgi:hypothetical protein